MAGRSAVLSVDILVDAAKASAGFDKAAGGVEKLQGKVSKMALPAAGALTAVVAFGKGALTAASDAQQAMGGVETVFGKSADQVKAWGAQAATSAGLSSTEYAVAAAKIGSQLKTAGVPMDQIADKTKTMIQQGADLSAVYGGTAADAVDALSSAMKGESDPAERLGLGISAAAVAAEMAAEGTDKLTGKAQTAAKAQATMALISKQSAASMGQFAAQSNTAGEKSQIAGAAWKNTATTLGGILLPAATAVAGILGDVATWLGNNTTVAYALIGAVALLAGGVLAVSAATKVWNALQQVWSAATKAMTAVQWLLNAAMSANPIALVIIAIVALVAGIVLLWTKSQAFRDFVLGMWKAIQAAALAAWKAIQAAAAVVWAALTAAARALQTAVGVVWTGIKTAAEVAWKLVSTIVGGYIKGIVLLVQGILAAAKLVWTGIKTAADAVWKGIQTGFDTMGKAIGVVWDGIVAAVDWAAALIPTAVQGIIDAVVAIWQGLVDIVSHIWDDIIGVVQAAIKPITDAIGAITQVWDDTVGVLSRGIDTVAGWISNLFGKIKNPPALPTGPAPGGLSAGGFAVAASPGLSPLAVAGGTAAAVWRSSSSPTPTIVVNGALDPDAVARQIRAILTGRDRRTSGVRIGGVAV